MEEDKWCRLQQLWTGIIAEWQSIMRESAAIIINIICVLYESTIYVNKKKMKIFYSNIMESASERGELKMSCGIIESHKQTAWK